jgi:anti-anti-sigma factor
MELWTHARPGFPALTVEVGGEIDVESGPCLADRLCSTMRAYGPRIALDLTGVTFFDCSGVSALLASRRAAQMHGGWLRLVAVSQCVRRIIEITGLQDALAMPSAGTALCPPERDHMASNEGADT